jgi:hypothetical protein
MRFSNILALVAIASTNLVWAAPIASPEPEAQPGYGSYGDYGKYGSYGKYDNIGDGSYASYGTYKKE